MTRETVTEMLDEPTPTLLPRLLTGIAGFDHVAIDESDRSVRFVKDFPAT